ncbi:hypothetical protein [Telluribacter sp. SYSU D00476]|uniref:hypothetical protein n=1 Tax=Telluribacter sp. SYSU D00476 TaxID=2811430 RepID=UPI001FF685FB|nr:hypothetical protein [Telluribacter sp. SYSU D00476]
MNKYIETSQYLTPNLYITRNEADIIDCLVDHQEMPHSFDDNKVISFFSGKDFHLVLFFPQQEDRGFQMYIVQDFSVHVDELFALREMFGQLIEAGQNVRLMKKAQYRVDNLIHMARTFRAMMHKELAHMEDDMRPDTFPNY